MASTLNFTLAPFTRVTSSTTADSTNAKDILPSSGTKHRRVYGITIWTDESTARDVSFHLTDGTTVWEMTTLAVPINAGNTNAIVPVDAFASTQMSPYIRNRDASGAAYIHIPIGWALRLNYNAAITATRQANITIVGEEY